MVAPREKVQRTKTPNEEVSKDPDPVSDELEANRLVTYEEADGDTYYFIEVTEEGFGPRKKIKGELKDFLIEKAKKVNLRTYVVGSKLKNGWFDVSFDAGENVLSIGDQNFEVAKKVPEDEIVVAPDTTDFLVNAGALTSNFIMDPSLSGVIKADGTISRTDEDAFNALAVGTSATQNKTKKLVILEKDGQLRISTLTGDFSGKRSGVLKFYDSVLETKNGKPAAEKSRPRPLKNKSYREGGQINARPANRDGWEVVGVINTTDPVPAVDLIVTGEQLANDSIFNKKTKGFENGMPVPDEGRMQKMAQGEMDRIFANDARLIGLENELDQLIDRQTLNGEDVKQDMEAVEREIAEIKEEIQQAVNKTFKLKGKKEEYRVADVLASISAEKDAIANWEEKRARYRTTGGVRKTNPNFDPNFAKSTKGMNKNDYIIQYKEENDIPTFPKEVRDEALRIEQKAIKQSDQSMASSDVAETQVSGSDRDSNRDDTGSEDIGELSESLLNQSSADAVGGVTSRAEGGDLIYAKEGVSGLWPSKDVSQKQGRLDPKIFLQFLEARKLAKIFRVLTDAKSLLQSHNGLDDRLHGKGMSDAHKARKELDTKIRQIETHLGTQKGEIRSAALKDPNTINNLDARLTKAELELAREIYYQATKTSKLVKPYQRKATSKTFKEATQSDVREQNQRFEDLTSLANRESDPAKIQQIADAIAQLEPINVGDRIEIPAGSLITVDPSDAQLLQGMDQLIDEVAMIDSASTTDVKGIPDDFLGLPAFVIGMIKEAKRSLNPRRLTEIRGIDSPLTLSMLAIINDAFPGNIGVQQEYIGPSGANRRDFEFGAFLKDGLAGNNYEQVKEVLDHIENNFFKSEDFSKVTNNEVKKVFRKKIVPMLHALYGLDTDGNIVEEINGPEGVVNHKMFALDLYRYFGPAEFKDDTYVDISSREVTADVDAQFLMTSLAGYGLMDPTTNQNVDTPMIIVDDKTESLEMQRARNMIGSVASPINPMESLGMTENLQQARAAQDRFGKPEIPFSGRAAVSHILKNIKSDFNNAEMLDYVARVLQQSKFMDTVKVRFAPWEKFRQYAQSNGDEVSAAVYLGHSNEILVSDIFYTDTNISADESLYAAILHELIHAPTRTALDVGYAYNNDIDINSKVGNIIDMQPGVAEEMGKIYSNIKDVIIPAVTLSNESQSVELTHALSSPHEFMASLTGSQLVDALKKTRLSEKDRRKLGMGKRSWIRTAWDAVKTFLLRMIGFTPSNTDALQYTMDQLDRTVEIAQGLAKSRKAIARANVTRKSVLDMLVGIKGANKLGRKTFGWHDGTDRSYIEFSKVKLAQVEATANEYQKDGEHAMLTVNGEEIDYIQSHELQLKDLLEHPTLFEAYPEIAEMSVNFRVSEDDTYYGYFERDDFSITFAVPPGDNVANKPSFNENRYANPKYKEMAKRANRLRSKKKYEYIVTLFHEIQHAVDAIEGHPPGTSAEEVTLFGSTFLQEPELFASLADDGVFRETLREVAGLGKEVPGAVDNNIKSAAYELNNFLSVMQDTTDALLDDMQIFGITERESGELTAETTGQLAISAIKRLEEGKSVSAGPFGEDGLGPYRYFNTYFKNAWMLPQPQQLAQLKKYLADYSNWIGMPAGRRKSINKALDVIISLSGVHHSSSSMRQRRKAQPDASEMVHKNAHASAFNELEALNMAAYQFSMQNGEIKMTYEEYLEKYGKVGNRRFDTLRKRNHKGVDNAETLRIGDEGKNQVMRTQAVSKALKWISSHVRSAFKEIGDAMDNKKQYQQESAEIRDTLRDAAKGNLNSVQDIARWLKERSISKLTYQKLERMFAQLDVRGLTTAQANAGRRIDEGKLANVLLKVSAREGIENGTEKEIYGFLTAQEEFSGTDIETRAQAIALTHSIRNNKDGLISLLRLSTDQGISSERGRILNVVKKIANAGDMTALNAIDITGYGESMLENIKKIKEKELTNNEKIEQIDIATKVYQRRIDTLRPREKYFRSYLGELEPVDITNGVTVVGMSRRRDENGNLLYDEGDLYKIKRIKVEIDGEKGIKNRKEFDQLMLDSLTFTSDQNNRDKYGSEYWFNAIREQALKAKLEPVGTVKGKFAAQRRLAFLEELESLNMRFARMGYEGTKISGMLARTQAIMRDLNSESAAHAKRANIAVKKVAEVMKMSGQEVFDMWQEIAWFMDNEAQYSGAELEEMYTELWKSVTKQGFIKPGVDAQAARRAVKSMIIRQIEARDFENRVNKKLGNKVEDDQVTVRSILDHSDVNLFRDALDLGYATFSRALNDNVITNVLNIMDEKVGKFTMDGKEFGPNEARRALTAEIGRLAEENNIEGITELLDRLYGGEVQNEFVEPYVTSGVRRTTFYGPSDNSGVGRDLGNSQVREAWEDSAGAENRMIKFLDLLYDRYNEKTVDTQQDNDRAVWYASFAKQLQKRYATLKTSGNRVAQKQHDLTAVSSALSNTPRSLDARQVESVLPRKFFVYDFYDEVTSQIRLALMVTTSQFGRHGENANKLGGDYLRRQGKRLAEFNTLMELAMGNGAPVTHNEPQMRYSRAAKRAAYDELRRRGIKDPQKYWDQLYSDAVAFQDFHKAFDHLGKYYGHKNVAGPYADATLLLELLGTQAMAVLNNPKSSFWQGMALTEFPMAFRGLNRMSKTASIKAFQNLINQSFGGIVEAMGVQLPKMGRYAQNLNNTHFRFAEADMEFREYATQIGYRGRMIDGTKSESMKKGLRWLKAGAAHHRQYNKEGTRAPFDLLTPITGIFPWFNGMVNHSVAVGASYAIEDEILRAAEYIERTGMSEIREIDPNELGLTDEGVLNKYLIGAKDGWENANNMLQRSGLPTISRMAFMFVERKKRDPNAPVLEKEDVLQINQMAMNNMTGEGFNAKPAFLTTNPVMRYAGFFMGWPLFKMATTHDFIFRRSSADIDTYTAFLKYLGLLSAYYMPMGLAASFMIDWYDEEVIGKPNNLPPLTPWAMLPIVGIPMAATDEQFTLYSVTSRLARAGSVYGMGFEVANSMFATGDPYGASREFSLDSRVFAFSMFRNIKDALGAYYHQGEADYGNVVRPVLYGIGGNSVIQQMDVVTNLFDIDIEERRMAEYIGARNYVKKTAWMMGLPLRPPSKGWGRPTPISVNVRQMERAAYANDTKEFLTQYQEAVEAAREWLTEQGRSDDPEKYVIERFRQRNLRIGVTQGKITDTDWQRMLDIMDPDVSELMKSYMRSHDSYLNMIKGSVQNTTLTPTELRRQMMISQYF